MEQQGNSRFVTFIVVIIVIAMGVFAWHVYGGEITQLSSLSPNTASSDGSLDAPSTVTESPAVSSMDVPAAPAIAHIATPSEVKAIYISSWSAGTASSMVHLNGLLDAGKLNSAVIDIKDATGRLSYQPLDPVLVATGAATNRIAHLNTLIQSLHDRNIYVIGRVAVFQDPYYPTIHPEAALQDTRGGVWKDSKGLTWLREDDPAVWHYIESIAEDAYAQGFDEINVDYVRFPSDGSLKTIDTTTFSKSKQDTIAGFFTDLDTTLRQKDHIPLSADIFGLTMTAQDDLGIGQKLELIAPHVDYVCPMIYPSHFSTGSYGFKNPADHPYDVIHHALTDGIAKLTAANISTDKIRPWLQDFNLGAIYTADMVQAQIDATSDVGLHSWLMWDAGNKYTSSVYK